MFRRRQGGLFDLCLAVICVWGAAYHTPVGALVRTAAAWVTGSKAPSRTLLSYYRGGIFDAGRADPTPVMPTMPAGPMPPSRALAYGVRASLGTSAAAARVARETAGKAGLHEIDPSTAKVEEVERVITAAAASLGSTDAAVLALFCGWDVATYAVSRVGAAGSEPTLEELIRYVPPSRAAALGGASQALTAGTAWALAWPVDAATRVSSPFGYRIHPTLGTRKLHTGVDLAVPEGTNVRATGAGIVRRASEDGVNGRVIIVDHGHGVATAYCHNSAVLLGVGDRVETGQILSRSGNTGRSSGPHLHYQLELGSKPVDPLGYRPGATAAEQRTE